MISWSTVVKIDQRQRNRVDKGILTVLMGGKEGNAWGGVVLNFGCDSEAQGQYK